MARRNWAGQNAYNQKYQKSHYDTLILHLPKGMKDDWKEAARIRDTSLAAYVKYCVQKDMYG